MSYRDKLINIHRFYGVEIEYLKPKFNRVHYILETEFLNYERNFYRVKLTRQKLYVNNKQLTKTIEILAYKCAQIFYPLILEVSFSGVVSKIANLEEIQERWSKKLPTLKREYAGKVALNYMSSITKNIQEHHTFLSHLKRDPLYTLLFPRLFVLGEAALEKEGCIITLPHHQYSSGITFIGIQKISK